MTVRQTQAAQAQSATTTKQKPASQSRGQKKAANGEKTTPKANKKEKEPAVKKDTPPKKDKDGLPVNKEALTLLLKQAMKLSMDQKQAFLVTVHSLHPALCLRLLASQA
nr:hypothetical protein BaRGS_030592 [Batillaria attramentaria]